MKERLNFGASMPLFRTCKWLKWLVGELCMFDVAASGFYPSFPQKKT